jgi:extracellular elastinolytic metalloproteinase
MFLCNSRDGDLDNAVIAHEYGHGISNRLTGGPAASGCLGNQEQMGEGWSDWFGLMMTIEVGDTETDNRPIGTYLFGQPIDGAGIRPYPYTTDMAVNPMTYASSFSGVSVPHGLGSVWCTMLWDMTWMMVDEYGFDSDLYDGTGGNNMAMDLVI